MSWTAIVPVKPPALGKTRLASLFAPEERGRIGEAMLDHGLRVLHADPAIRAIHLLCRAPPRGWTGPWIADFGRGLNVELDHAARDLAGPLLVIHADLPALQGEDVAILLAAADGGAAIAPDRHGTGTNALALADARPARFAFGSGSFAAHRRLLPAAAIVDRPGLSHDLDTPDDAAMLRGLALGPPMRALLADRAA